MGRRLSKKQAAIKKQQHKEKKFKKTQKRHQLGLIKKSKVKTVSPKYFYIVKIILAALTVTCYFVYSPLLIVCIIAVIISYLVATSCEKGLNKSYLKSNQVTLFKFDIGIAFSLLIITIFGTIFNLGGQSFRRFGRFGNTWYNKIIDSIKGFGTLLTGQRSIFGRSFNFAMAKPPETMGNFDPSLMPNGQMMRPPSIDDIPLEFLFSNLLSTLMTVLIFVMVFFIIVGIYHDYRKIKHQSETLEDCRIGDRIKILTDDNIDKILDFGVINTEEEV